MDTILPLMITLATIGLGLAYVTGQVRIGWKKGKTDAIKEADGLDDRLISLLKDTATSLEKRVTDLENIKDHHTKLIESLRHENEILTRIFQGRDEQTVAFQEEGFKAIKRTEELLLVTNNSYNLVKKTNENVERLALAIERHLQIIEATSIASKAS